MILSSWFTLSKRSQTPGKTTVSPTCVSWSSEDISGPNVIPQTSRSCVWSAAYLMLYTQMIKGSLRNDDGGGNEIGKKAVGLDKRNNNFARAHHAFLYISLPSLHDYHVKLFCRRREQKTTTFFFFSWTLMQSFRIQLQNNLPTFDELSVIKFEAEQIHWSWGFREVVFS